MVVANESQSKKVAQEVAKCVARDKILQITGLPISVFDIKALVSIMQYMEDLSSLR